MDEKKKKNAENAESEKKTVNANEEASAKQAEEESAEEGLKKANAALEEYKDRWMRSVAEFDNYKKRNALLYADAYGEGQRDMLEKLLPIGDNLETAVTMIADENAKKGVELLLKQYKDVLEKLGAEEIDPTGKPFSPDDAEAVMRVKAEDGEETGVVKTTFRKGYRLKGKTVRYAQVSVTAEE